VGVRTMRIGFMTGLFRTRSAAHQIPAQAGHGGGILPEQLILSAAMKAA
jgi:hypothetical protein